MNTRALLCAAASLSLPLAPTSAQPATGPTDAAPPVLDFMAMNTIAWDGNLEDIRRLSKALGLRTVAATGHENTDTSPKYKEDLLFLINDAHKNVQPLVGIDLTPDRLAELSERYPYTMSFYPRLPRGIDVETFDKMRERDPDVFEAYRKKFESTKAWANTNLEFPHNIAQLQTWGSKLYQGKSARWEPSPDFQQQAVIDELVADIVANAKAEEIPDQNWLFKGLVIDVIEIWKEFNWNSERGIPGEPETERTTVLHDGITHEFTTFREGWYHFLADLRDALEAEFPDRDIKYVWEPTPFVDPGSSRSSSSPTTP